MNAHREGPGPVDRHVGRCLRASRMARGWSLAEVEARTGLPKMNVQAWEMGRRACPLEILAALAAFYGARVTDFMPLRSR